MHNRAKGFSEKSLLEEGITYILIANTAVLKQKDTINDENIHFCYFSQNHSPHRRAPKGESGGPRPTNAKKISRLSAEAGYKHKN